MFEIVMFGIVAMKGGLISNVFLTSAGEGTCFTFKMLL